MRGYISKRAKIITIIAFALSVVGLVVYFTRYRPSPTGMITNGVYAIKSLFMNFYVIETTDGYMLFDTGLFPRRATKGLRKLRILPEEVTHIFLTHSDIDHANGISAFPHATIYLSQAEVPLIDGTMSRFVLIPTKKINDYQTLEDGAIIWVRETKIQVIHTPGHTPGSVCYLINDSILVTGDLLRYSLKGEIQPFSPSNNMDQNQAKESINTVMPILEEMKYILTAHNGYKHRLNEF